MDQAPNDNTPESDASIAELCGQLVDDAKEFGRAEISRVRAIIFRRIVKGRLAILFGFACAALALAAMLVLLVGVLLFLSRHIGVLAATAIVTVGAALAAALCGWLAFRRVKLALSKEDDLL
ncbi:MAG TPA: hypothetical protein VFT56_11040 [Sphingomonas sp.]|nr:hypothetical protein [Sphingomonas sp.]